MQETLVSMKPLGDTEILCEIIIFFPHKTDRACRVLQALYTEHNRCKNHSGSHSYIGSASLMSKWLTTYDLLMCMCMCQSINKLMLA